jgi:hypothetical protein
VDLLAHDPGDETEYRKRSVRQSCAPEQLIMMKPTVRKSRNGSVLVLSLLTCTLVGLALGSCLVLIANRNLTAMRATAWNTAIPVLEAGIEEALTHLHHDSNNPTANDWTAGVVDGKPVYWKHREFPDGSHYYVTNFGFGSSSPVIHSAGYVPSPLSEDQYISRLVAVGTTNPPSLFNYAIAANGPVKLSGSAVVDGYDSSIGNYDPVTNRMANGGIATNSKLPKAIDVGSAHLYGKAVTGPGGTVSVSGGSIGDLSWESGIQPGDWVNNDMNVQFQPNSPPAPIGTDFPEYETVGTTNFTYLGSGSYTMDEFISNHQTRPMVITGKATLYVKNNFTVSGLGGVYVESGASLKLYVGGTASIGGDGVVNRFGSPANFSFFGLPTCTSVILSGWGNLVGTINAPQADFKATGTGSIFGAVICNTFTSSGTTGVHYDQAAGYQGIFLVTSWQEQ